MSDQSLGLLVAKVTFPDSLLIHTDGVREVELHAENYRDLLQVIAKRWPGLREPLSKASVAIDGQIYQDAFLEPISTSSEVFFLPRIEGG